jgi:hypothetical protein
MIAIEKSLSALFIGTRLKKGPPEHSHRMATPTYVSILNRIPESTSEGGAYMRSDFCITAHLDRLFEDDVAHINRTYRSECVAEELAKIEAKKQALATRFHEQLRRYVDAFLLEDSEVMSINNVFRYDMTDDTKAQDIDALASRAFVCELCRKEHFALSTRKKEIVHDKIHIYESIRVQ